MRALLFVTLLLCAGATSAQQLTGAPISANALTSATTVVNVSAATAPSAGQVLTATSSTAATWQAASGGPSCLKDFYTDVGNVGAGETDLYSFTTVANQLSAVGQKITATYGGLGAASGTHTPSVRAYFAGTSIYDSSLLASANSGGFSLSVTIIRTGASAARAIATYVDDAQVSDASETDLTGLTFSATNILKITGQDTGSIPANNTVIAKLGTISWVPAGP